MLAADILEIHYKMLRLTEQYITVGFDGDYPVALVHEMNHVEQRTHGIDVNPSHHGRFSGIYLGDDEA